MSRLNNVPEFSKYFRAISPSEININKEEIFYRDKYNDIVNYIKFILTKNQELELKEYIEPKDAILINVNPGTDILEFLRLISINYYIDFIEFNKKDVIKTPDDFLKSLNSISKILRDNLEEKTGVNNEKRLFLIDQKLFNNQNFKDNNLLEIFTRAKETNKISFNCNELGIILVWINYNFQEIKGLSNNLYNTFDLFIKIKMLDKFERETVLRDFLENNSNIVFDIKAILDNTERWEVKDIKELLKVGIFRHFLNYELNNTSNEITDSLLNLIKSGEYMPSISTNILEIINAKDISDEGFESEKIYQKKAEENVKQIKDIGNFVDEIRETRISEFMLTQLYENAASKNYNELIIIIDKLNKNERLEENDRKLLAKYPFILNDSPNRAQINLEKAKKRVDRIKQVFGK